jgi:hypothetical protein
MGADPYLDRMMLFSCGQPLPHGRGSQRGHWGNRSLTVAARIGAIGGQPLPHGRGSQHERWVAQRPQIRRSEY